MPAPTEPKVTTSVALPTNVVTGLTTTFTAVLGPVVVLQVSVTVAGVAVRRFWADTGRVVATIPAISHKADRLARSIESFISKSCSSTFSASVPSPTFLFGMDLNLFNELANPGQPISVTHMQNRIEKHRKLPMVLPPVTRIRPK
jgi:hypothetical protein